MLHAVIMAGGSGTRFWPESRATRPKQLISLAGKRTMLQETVDRLDGLIPPQRVTAVTNARLADEVRRQLPGLPPSAVIGEPAKRDTAPCIGLAAGQIAAHDADATLVVMPSDHVIQPPEKLREAIDLAVRLVEERPERIVTFGIKPTYPAETFGYIERGEPLNSERDSPAAFHVARFREKPDAAAAKAYLDSGKFYWNSGIFVWKAQTILRELGEHQPDMRKKLDRINAALGREDYQEILDREFTSIRGVSIDYAVMEHAKEIVVVEAPFEWDDLGTWQSLARLHGADLDGNTSIGKHLAVETKGTIVRSSNDHLIVTIGLKDAIVVHTPDATLVAAKDQEERVREIVERIKEREWDEYL